MVGSLFEYILKIEQMPLYDRLNEKKRIKNDSKSFGLATGRIELASTETGRLH